MADESKTGAVPALTSEWGGLSPHLIATFFAVKKVKDEKSNYRWVRDMDQPEVRAPITDANINAQLNWQSPFENMSPDQQMDTASGLIQSGGFTATLEALRSAVGAGAVVVVPGCSPRVGAPRRRRRSDRVEPGARATCALVDLELDLVGRVGVEVQAGGRDRARHARATRRAPGRRQLPIRARPPRMRSPARQRPETRPRRATARGLRPCSPCQQSTEPRAGA